MHSSTSPVQSAKTGPIVDGDRREHSGALGASKAQLLMWVTLTQVPPYQDPLFVHL